MFVSQVPNSDPQPWVSTRDGRRFDHNWHGAPSIEFDPRPEFDHTRDPYPWISPEGARWEMNPIHDNEWAPRREQFDVPVNRVLEAFRGIPADKRSARWVAAGLDGYQSPYDNFTPEEIDHARRVLSKLVNVYGA